MSVEDYDQPFNVVTIGQQGPAGPPGTGSLTFTANAAVDITIGDVVVLTSMGLALADPTNIDHVSLVLGIATNSATSGDSVQVITSGEALGFIGLSIGAKYYLGLNGTLSTTIPDTAVWNVINGLGNALSPTILILSPGLGVIFS